MNLQFTCPHFSSSQNKHTSARTLWRVQQEVHKILRYQIFDFAIIRRGPPKRPWTNIDFASTIENRETTSKRQKLFWDKNIDEALLFPGYFSLVREYFSFAASLRSSSLWSILTCHSFSSLWSWNGHNIGLLVSGETNTSFWDSIPNFLSQLTVLILSNLNIFLK